ncbi:2-aminoethylphosphonate--pyruvate transaminase-like [Diadema antillarum]|uniref:2-aminoethylphosphonate--pyruvate transaminase-like n=1 Tax=Diadema antillarum TaxID=105358 RepID=UPI003A8BD9AC
MENGLRTVVNSINGASHEDGEWRYKRLFTPGPLGVSLSTKEAMLRDVGSRDTVFIQLLKSVRASLLRIAGVSGDTHTSILMQGSGTFSVEAALTTSIPRENPRVLLLVNGAYGKRMIKIVKTFGIPDKDVEVMDFPENEKISPYRVEERLKEGREWTTVAIVHCETTSGVINPITAIGRLVKQYCPDAMFIVDAMSSFGAIPIPFEESHIDFLVSSANKCLEGVPGFGLAIVRKGALKKCQGRSRSLSLDLFDQWETFERTGQFRFTPPTHTILAFHQALLELEQEGGVQGRLKRYQENRRILRDGMRELGFREFLDETHEGCIITSYHYPTHPNFDFQDMYRKLSDMDLVIYPGKVTQANCFRIGNIGHLFPDDMRHLLSGVRKVFEEMYIPLPLSD